MYVCHCAVVTERDVMASIANGARCIADVARETSAGQTCGGCVATLRELVCQHCPVTQNASHNRAGAGRGSGLM
jgi:bacterioferritin-associated ferredoxin